MKPARRKVTLQLMPMLDLMLIVIFAQYLAMRDQSQHEEARASQAISEVEKTRAALAEERREAEWIADKALNQRDLVGQLASELFNLPDDTINQLLKERFPDNPPVADEIAAMQQEFRRLRDRRGQEVIKHLLTFNEIRKRCDVWELYTGETGLTTMKTGETEVSFRAKTPQEFASQVFAHYRSLAQPKSLVLIVFSYGDIVESTLEAAAEGLPLAINLMKNDSAGRTRFEFTVLGHDPKKPK